MNKFTKVALLALVALAPAASLRAGLLEFCYYGQAEGGYSSSGLGLVSMPAGLGDPVLANPALLASGGGLCFQATGSVNWIQQKRTREVFDSYSNSVGLNTDLLNSNFYYKLQSLSVGYSLKPSGLPHLGVGFGFAPEYTFQYDYHREIRDGFYYITETRDISGTGAINRFTGALSCRPLNRLAMGLGLSRLQGHQELRLMYAYTDPTQTDYSQSNTYYYKGNRLEAGLWALPFNRLTVGISAHTPAKLTGNAWARRDAAYADTNSSVTYPAGYTFGVSYYPSNEFPATISLEYSYTPWHRLEDNLNPENHLQAVNSYGMAVEHRLPGGLPLRFGLSFANSYLNRGIGLARAGLGTEVPAGPVAVAVGANVGRRSYNLGQATGTTDPTTVTESVAELSATVSLR